jgi:cytochrome c biogenesis protein CcdA
MAMIDTSLSLLPFLVADIVNPVLFAFMVYAAGTNRPVLNSGTVLLGHTLAYFSVGIIVASGLQKISNYLQNPQAIDYVLSFIVGILLLWVALSGNKKNDKKKPENGNSLTPVKALGMGALINFIGAPFALPYFAAIDQILKANHAAHDELSLLAAYNILYALPFLIIPALVVVNRQSSAAILQRINSVLDRASRFLMPMILFAVGLTLVVDAAWYFITGEGLY